MNVVVQLRESGKEIQNFRHSTTLSSLITAVVRKRTHTLLTIRVGHRVPGFAVWSFSLANGAGFA